MKNLLATFLASRVWSCDPASLEAWANARESIAHLAELGLSQGPLDRAKAALAGNNPMPYVVADGVATIPVQGVLMLNGPWWAAIDGDSTDYLHVRNLLARAAADPDVAKVILAIDSPGGDAIGLTETVAAIAAVRAAGKAIVAQVSGMCCSAAYFLACACDSIRAEADAMVGSIGTYAVLRDTSGLQEQLGIRMVLVSSGPVKGAGADGKVTDAYKAATQARIDALAAEFVSQVAVGRGMSLDVARSHATGDTWLGAAALARDLIDSIGACATAIPASLSASSDGTSPDDTTPAADPSAKETRMALKVSAQDMVDLVDAHAAHATLIQERAKAGDSKDQILAAVDTAKRTAAEQAKDARILALERDLAAKHTELAAVQAAHAADKTAHAAALAEAKGKQDAAAALAALAKGAGRDPGHGTVDGKPAAKDGAPTMTESEFLAAGPEARNEFKAKGGRLVPDAPAK